MKGKGLYAAAVSSTAVSAGAVKGKQVEINPGDIPKIVQDSQPKIDKLTLNMANLDPDSSGTDLGTLQFSLNIQIERGQDGVWGVKYAHVIGPTQGPEASFNKPNSGTGLKPDSKLPTEPKGPRTRMRFQKPKKSKVVWRPKSISKSKLIQTQVGSPPTASTQTLKGPALTPPSPAPATASTSASPKLATTFDMGVTALVPHPGEVTRTWGSSSDWVLELRDGRRLSIPISLLRPYLGEF